MQTFLPFADFRKSLRLLDYKRLGKQRIEALQLINAVLDTQKKDGTPSRGWKNHPCTVMWRGYADALKVYHDLCIDEWIERGYNNTMKKFNLDEKRVEMPDWLGFEPFHSSHRSVLLNKDYSFYSKYKWKENPSNIYVWRDKDKKWYYYLRDEKRRKYFGN